MLCVMMLSLCVDSTASAKERKLAKYDDAGGFSEGLAAVEKDGKWGYIDKKGKEVVKPKYDYVHVYFSDGLVLVKARINEEYTYIAYMDKTGRYILDKEGAVRNRVSITLFFTAS